MTVALHVVVATVEDASVACRVIEYVPGDTAIVCDDVVAPLPQRNATGSTPPAEDAFHVIALADGKPAHVAVSADAASAKENKTKKVANIADAPTDKDFFANIGTF